MKDILILENVHKSFNGLKVVKNVSLKIKEKTITGLIGPNGSGKTTLFNLISGIYKIDNGKIFFNGERIDNLKPYEISNKGIIKSFQIPRIFKRLTILENMLIAAENIKGEKILNAFNKNNWIKIEEENIKKALNILEFLELKELKNSLPTKISGGQLKLLEIGRALMCNPRMLLLDELVAGINPLLAEKIFRKIIDLRNMFNITFFIIEHRIEFLFDFAEYIFVMDKGEIIAEGTPKEIINNERVLEAYLGEK
ncbi:MAG: ABC transporter ATP-binding protein [Nitrososphaerota archaeon]